MTLDLSGVELQKGYKKAFKKMMAYGVHRIFAHEWLGREWDTPPSCNNMLPAHYVRPNGL